ncbi:MAG: 50S ribosomal protein L30 [Oscillospiraceae bacterium]
MLKVKLVKGLAGVCKSQLAIVESLGLKKVGDIVEQPDNAATMGKVKKVSHLVKII